MFGYGIEHTHHWSNGTVKTVVDLTGTDVFTDDYRDIINKLCATPYITEIIPKMVNYYETKEYVFVHGWIPCYNRHGWSANYYSPIEDWREVGESGWKEARWINGILAYSYGVAEQNKTIICGHWHCSWGHCRLEGACSEFGKDSDFSPFYADGIIAIDGCTAYSGKVNCIVLEEENVVCIHDLKHRKTSDTLTFAVFAKTSSDICSAKCLCIYSKKSFIRMLAMLSRLLSGKETLTVNLF